MSGNADALASPSKATTPPRSFFVKPAAGLCAFVVVVYQSWFMPFFLPFFMGRDDLARSVIYAIYGGVLIAAIAILATRRDVSARILPLAIAAAIAVAATALHSIGIVAKSYLVTLFLGGAAIVLMLASAPLVALRLSASVTALNAVICLLDLFFADGFTSTPGRAAGLAINPNVAAAGLLLGAAASHRAVSKTWRASFLILVGTALLVTLSRSTILAAVATVAVPIAVRIWPRYRDGRRFQLDPKGRARACAVGLVLLGTIGAALTVNAYFRAAIDGSVTGIVSLADALDAAARAVDASVDQAPAIATPPSVPAPPPSSGAPTSALSSPTPKTSPRVTAAPSPLSSAPAAAVPPTSPKASPTGNVAKIEALGERLTGEGGRNSISARALFLERGLLAYREGGFFGRGLEEAQPLAPHNTFVLFAIAFGHFGWLIPLGVVAFTFWFVRDASDLPLGVALVGVMLTSHDLLLTPSLFLPAALGVGGMIAGRMAPVDNDGTAGSFAFGTVSGVAFFVAGCIAILLLTPPFAVKRLRADTIYAARGGYETLLAPPQFPGLFRFSDLAPGLSSSAASYMREDTASLQRVEWSPQARPAVRPSEYTFRRRGTLLFAASDGSDPRQNGRDYEVGIPLSINPLCYLLLCMTVAWSLAMLASLRRSRRLDRR